MSSLGATAAKEERWSCVSSCSDLQCIIVIKSMKMMKGTGIVQCTYFQHASTRSRGQSAILTCCPERSSRRRILEAVCCLR